MANVTTGSMTVDTLGEWLITISNCFSIHIAEDAQLATANWFIQAPNSNSPKLQVPAGQARDIISKHEMPAGTKVCFISAASGSMTFTWMETL